ncbi:histidine phosphatase superfamily [Poronia punctata]|nr:histidine phosphatase superfamily [Poronia punctata]
MAPTIDIIRHAEAYNIISDQFLDPVLTPVGIAQSLALRASYPYHHKVKRIYASPLRRTILTAQLAIPPTQKQPLILLPELQENSARPCDTGSPLSTLKREFRAGTGTGTVDTTFLLNNETWFLKSPQTQYYPSLYKVEARARIARERIRESARELADDERIVVVTHGAFAHFLVQDFADLKPGRGAGVWENAGVRSFQFNDRDELVEVPDGSWAELNEEERKRQRGYAVERLRRHEVDARDIFSSKEESCVDSPETPI